MRLLFHVCNLFFIPTLFLGVSFSAFSQTSPPSSKGLYKWIDESGRVHYSTSIPPEAIENKIDILDRGLIKKHSDAQKTPQQIEQDRQEQIKKDQLKKEEEENAKRYKILQQRYKQPQQFDEDLVKLNEEWDKRLLPLTQKQTRLKDEIKTAQNLKNKDLLASLKSDEKKNDELIESFESQRQADIMRNQKDKSLWIKFSLNK